MRVACTRSLDCSGSLRAELRALNYSKWHAKKKLGGLLNLSEAVVFAFDSSVSLSLAMAFCKCRFASVFTRCLARLSRAPHSIAVLAVWSASEPVLYTSAVIDGQCAIATAARPARTHILLGEPASPRWPLWTPVPRRRRRRATPTAPPTPSCGATRRRANSAKAL